MRGANQKYSYIKIRRARSKNLDKCYDRDQLKNKPLKIFLFSADAFIVFNIKP